MWTWVQTGTLIGPDNLRTAGYSGKGEHQNRPESQQVKNWGPIPCGLYTIGAHVDTMTHGPFVLPLTPSPQNEMFGRSAFLIHGDSKVAPGSASEGCIILSRSVRERIAKSGDHELRVIPREEAETITSLPPMASPEPGAGA